MRVAPGRETVLFIVGPTAVGKTGLAVKLARRLNGEIVSCDSMQVYKAMPILSQAPCARDKKAVRHHLVGIVEPSGEYSVASFLKQATKAIESILKRGKQPIVVGGTGLYAKALIDGLFPSPEADLVFRKKMQEYAARYGNKKLYAKLVKIDPDAAVKIHPNDIRRVIRALEIYQATGKTMTELKLQTKGLSDKYSIKIFGLTRLREKLYKVIDGRVECMLAAGLVREVKRLKKRRLSKTAQAVLGFKEIDGYLKGEYSLADAAALLQMNTRRFAKRQFTWFKADKRVKWLDLGRLGQQKAVAKIVKQIKG